MIYTHVARKGVTGVTSPLDLLDGLRTEDVQAAVDATVRLGNADGMPASLALAPEWAGAEGR